MTERERKIALDKWYSEYCRENGVSPTLKELIEKDKELLDSSTPIC